MRRRRSSSAGTPSTTARSGAFARFALAALGALCALGLLAAGASAAGSPPEIGHFACSGANPCNGATTWSPQRLAVNEETGDVYVIDTLNNAVQKFSSSGAYLSQLTGFGGFGGDADVAVDNSGGANKGNVYVETESGDTYAFDSAGAPLWNVSPEYTCGVAVDNSGNPWIATYEAGLWKLSPADGSVVGSPVALEGGSTACHFAVDSEGDFVVNSWAGNINRFEPDGHFLFVYPANATFNDVTVDPGRVFGASEHSGIQYWEASGPALGSPFGPSVPVGLAADGTTHRLYATAGSEVKVFLTLQHTLTVVTSGSGSVTCDNGSCAAEYPADQPVTLQAQAAPGYEFAGWIGCKSTGAGACEASMSADTEVTAIFLKAAESVTVTPEPPGANCPNGGVLVESPSLSEYICNGAKGSNGSNGANGSNGSNGASGKDGAAGPPGPQGKEGPPAKVTCKVKGAKKPKVTCTVKQGASASRVRWRLMRGGDTVRHGASRHGRVRLGALPSGHYRLRVEGQKGATAIVVG